VFNALRADELLTGVGRVLRMIADTTGPLEEYERSQTLSAYSVTRLLAAEEAAAHELFRDTRLALLEVLSGDDSESVGAMTEADASAIQEARTAIRQARTAIGQAETGVEVGEAVGDLLSALPRDAPARPRTHAVLAQMIDREVAALAAQRQ
jgi:hypothetical protein